MRRILALFVFAILACLILLNYTKTQMQNGKDSLLMRQNQILETSYKAVTQMYKVSIENYFKYVILQKDVLAILHEAKDANEEKKASLRGSLYRLLYPIYSDDFQKIGIRQLHFHTTQGESFLRFHKPSENGDPLFDIRPSIKIANTEKKFVSGFEGGRIYPGFRYVFPIIDKGEHLGSVEISLPYESIESELSKLFTCKNHILLMKKSVATDLVFDNHKDFFMPSSLSDTFVIENPKISKITKKAIDSPFVEKINTLIKKEYPIEKLLLGGNNFSIPIVDGENGYIVNFHPIYDTSHKLAAYTVTYAATDELASMQKSYIIESLVGCFIVFLFSYGIYLYLKQNEKILFEKLQFETIVSTTVNGVLLLNTEGNITFMNLAACNILGYKIGETEGQSSHELIHTHDSSPSNEDCQILKSIKLQSSYMGEEVFKHKNDKKITVLININPFIQNGKSIGSVMIFRDITQEKKNQDMIEHLAYYDSLTELPNRKLLLDRLTTALYNSRRSLEFGGLLFIDLDNFKALNDDKGHDMGDKLLQEVALRLKEQLRACDTVARFGGDEFVVLLTQLGSDEEKAKEELYKIAQKLLLSITEAYHLPKFYYTCTASIGGTLFLDEDTTVDNILKNADTAMYEVKKGGKNEIKIL
ncbi:MAG: diguanylate cyclase [Campylobacteraceae bacterium]|nr:diguanylate cyclase [Campylobacteraceae bacterium]